MNILPQIYKNVLKERIKNKIVEFSDEFIDLLTDNLFNVSKDLRYVEMISGLQNKASKLLTAVIIETFEEIDKQFKVNPERIKRYTINKSNVPRTLITIFGEITYKRTYYISRLDK